jgi:sulfatase modifying factor 1
MIRSLAVEGQHRLPRKARGGGVLALVLGVGACNGILGNPAPMQDDEGTGGETSSGGTEGDGGQGSTSGGNGGMGGDDSQECQDCTATQGCVNGTCVEQSCEPEERFCSGNAVYECDADGLASTEVQSCAAGQYCDAASASCKDGVCAPNQPTCDRNISRLCNAGGTGFTGDGAIDCTTEDKTCVGGLCQGACAPDQTKCAENGIQTCNASGEYGAAEPCGDATCLGEDGSASCEGECAPDQTKCEGNGLRTCDANGEYGAADACENTTCVGADGNASCEGECAPDQTKCEGNDLRTCDQNGAYGATSTCEDSTCLGEDGSASCEGECAPDQTRCVGNGVQTCDETNGEYDPSVAPCGSTAPHCDSGGCGQPPSCQGLAAECGSSSSESCCVSPRVPGGTYNRINNASYQATVADFRLDKFEVTVGRWRKFVAAWDGGWQPAEGDGKHAHLNEGSGLQNSHADGGYEPGWSTSWATNIDTSGTARQEGNAWSTWTAEPGENEFRPINYLNWYESYAFCIWDGGFLPSEAEWNYAAAAGSSHREYPWAPPTAPGCGLSNYAGAAGPAECYADTHTIEVGVLLNGNGSYCQSDLAGNLAEWQLDWSAAAATAFAAACNDCVYLPSSASSRVQRGGAFNSLATAIVNTARSSGAPAPRTNNVGARCARTP